MRHFPLRECGSAIAFVALLATIYVVTYYAMIDPKATCAFWNVPYAGDKHTMPWHNPVYRFGGQTAVAFFAPWHEIDLRLRPDYWFWLPE
jgi:hypothetical protein